MEFTVDRKRLHDALQVVGGVAMMRTLKDTLQNVYVEARDDSLTLQATDYEVGVCLRIPDVTVEKPGVAFLPSAQTVGIFREVSEPEVTFKTTQSRCDIRAGRSRFKVVLADPETFPGLPTFPDALATRAKRDDLLGMLKHIVFASAEERTRYAFDGIKLLIGEGMIRMVSTDGKRLAHYWLPSDPEEAPEIDALLPARALGHFMKALAGDDEDLELAVESNRFAIRSANVEVHCQQIEGAFPNFVPLVDKALSRSVTLDGEEILGALRRANLFAGSESRVIRLRFEAGNLNVNSSEAEVGEAQTDLPVDYDGEALELGFNPDYLLDFLKIVGTGPVRMEFEDDQTASRWTCGEHFKYMVMPVSR